MMILYRLINKNESGIITADTLQRDDLDPVFHKLMLSTGDDIISFVSRGNNLEAVSVDNPELKTRTWCSYYTADSAEIIKVYPDIFKRETIQEMINDGIDAHTNNEILLSKAVEYGYLDAAEFLLKNGADPKVSMSLPLRLAIFHNRTAIIKPLLDAGADFKATPMTKIWTLKFGNDETKEVLKEYIKEEN